MRNGPPKAAVFLSRAVKGTKLLDEAIALLAKTEVPILKSVIHQKQAIADTFGQGATVWELPGRPAAESASEFDRLFRDYGDAAMTPKKPRKPLDDSLADVFVYGTSEATPIPLEPQLPQDAQSPTQSTEPIKPERVLGESISPKISHPNKSRVMDKLMSALVQKEPTIRFTVDLTETMHRKLSILAARTGKKKAEIVRMLLDEALQEVIE